MRTGVAQPGQTAARRRGDRGQTEDERPARQSSASIVILTSVASIFLPRYSGVRPIISPATNTATMDEQQHAEQAGARSRRRSPRPASCWPSAQAADSGMKLSCMALTAPSEEAVATSANSADWRRRNAPPCLPCCRRLLQSRAVVDVAWRQGRIGAGFRSIDAGDAGQEQHRHDANSAHPWRSSPTMRPKVLVSAAPSRKISSISTRFVSAVGFSNGCAELALKKPPPSPLNSLIASCEATGPRASDLMRALERGRVAVRRQASAARPARRGTMRRRRRSAAARRAWRGSDRPRNCRSSATGGARSRGSARRRRRCRKRRTRNDCTVMPAIWRQIAERRFAAVGLPARVGDEADGGVQRQIGRDGAEVLRIERQRRLQPKERIERDDAERVKDQKAKSCTATSFARSPA